MNTPAGKPISGKRCRRPLSVRANFSWALAGNLAFGSASWLVYVVLAQLGTQQMVGDFALGAAIAMPVFMLTSLNLRAVQATDASARYRFRHYLQLRLLCTAGGLTLVAILAVGMHLSAVARVTVLALGCARAVDAVSDILFGSIQRCERLDIIAQSLIIRSLGGLALLCLGLGLTGDLGVASACFAFGSIVTLLLFDAPMFLRLQQLNFTPATIASGLESLCTTSWSASSGAFGLAKYAWPMGLNLLIGGLIYNAPRYWIRAWLGSEQLGAFAAVFAIVLGPMMIVRALGEAILPRLAQLHAQGAKGAFVRLYAQVLALVSVLGIVGLLGVAAAGGPILALAYGPEYEQDVRLFLILTGAGAVQFVAVVTGVTLTALQVFLAPALTQVVSLALVVVGTVVMIPAIGVNGAAFALLISTVLTTISYMSLLVVQLRRKWRPAAASS